MKEQAWERFGTSVASSRSTYESQGMSLQMEQNEIYF